MTIRPYDPKDRPRALQVLKDHRAIDDPSNHILVTDGAEEGLALWHQPSAGPGLLAIVHAPNNRTLFYQLALQACERAIEAGLTQGYFQIHDVRLLDRLQRDFNINPVPEGREPNTALSSPKGPGAPTSWTVAVDLLDARDQLLEVLAVLQGRRPQPAEGGCTGG